jgi:hypothetical protein
MECPKVWTSRGNPEQPVELEDDEERTPKTASKWKEDGEGPQKKMKKLVNAVKFQLVAARIPTVSVATLANSPL